MIKFIYEHKVGPQYWEEEIDVMQYDKFYYYDEEQDKYYLYIPSTKTQEESDSFNLVPVYVGVELRPTTIFKILKKYKEHIILIDLNENPVYKIQFKPSIVKTDLLSFIKDLYFFDFKKTLEGEYLLLM